MKDYRKFISCRIQNGIRRFLRLACGVACVSSLGGCFTGIESTKRIEMSKDDRKALATKNEDLLFSGVSAQPLESWQPGKRFFVADEKVMVMLEPVGYHDSETTLQGKIVTFNSIDRRLGVDGKESAVIIFNCGNNKYKYTTSKTPEEALTAINSSQLPFMIDLDRVDDMKSGLVGKEVWTLTPLWSDASGNRIMGKKFIPVIITDILPGDGVFPVKVLFSPDSVNNYQVSINYGGDNFGSRKFKTLFSVTDPRLQHKNISDEVWTCIQEGRVRTGMTKEECKISLGAPDDVETGHTHSTLLDVWRYADGRILRFADGLLVDVWR